MIKLYNTLSGKKEEFVPIQPGKVAMYACGVRSMIIPISAMRAAPLPLT